MQKQCARILQPPLDIWNDEMSVTTDPVSIYLYRDFQSYGMLRAAEFESACELHSRVSLSLELARQLCSREVISGYRWLSRISRCILRSRPLLSVLPLVASTTTTPLAARVDGSKRIVPCLSTKLPVHGMHSSRQRELDLGFRRIEFNRHLLRPDGSGPQPDRKQQKSLEPFMEAISEK